MLVVVCITYMPLLCGEHIDIRKKHDAKKYGQTEHGQNQPKEHQYYKNNEYNANNDKYDEIMYIDDYEGNNEYNDPKPMIIHGIEVWRGHSDHEDEDDNNMSMDHDGNVIKYSDKNQLTGLLLTLFVGSFGAGRFYVEDYTRASIKLFLFLFLMCSAPGAIFIYICDKSIVDCFPPRNDIQDNCMGLTEKIFFVSYVGILGIFICWLIADIIMFSMNVVTDSDGFTLQPI